MGKKYLVGFICLVFVSCKKNFLDLSPISSPSVAAFYKTSSDIEIALNAAYGSLQRNGQYRYAYWNVGEVRSDNTTTFEGGGNLADAEIDQFKEGSSNSILNSMWLDTYNGILLCNVVIERVEKVTIDENLKKRFIGEAEFLRALMYFNLVRTFGDVPIVLKETTSVQEGYEQGRMATSEVYGQIIKDLSDAETRLPATYMGKEIGRATKGAAQALLGKVLLTKKDYAAAATKLKEVISSGTYQLLPDYGSLWIASNGNNAESIFEVQFKKGGTGTGSPYTNFFAPWNSGTAVTVVGFPYGRNLPTDDMGIAYEAGDKRRAASMADGYYDANGTFIPDGYTLKYKDVPFQVEDADNNWPVLRYADVMLMYAEALNETNSGPTTEAYKMLDDIRSRAGLGAIPAGLSKADFALALEHERQVELAFEGHRWFDLVRTGRALNVMNKHFNGAITIQEYQLLFPIPQTQISINPEKIKQNPGY